MKRFAWNMSKNALLKQERAISFEDIVESIESGGLLAMMNHPNQEKYPHQQVFVVAVKGYAYVVPFVESETEVFLKTIIPSRKATRQFIDNKE